MNPREVVTAFLTRKGKILAVKRSKNVRTYRGCWAGISGYVEEEPLQQAKTEIREETGLDDEDFQLVNRGKPLRVEDSQNKNSWLVYPFCFKLLGDKQIKLNRENTAYRWIRPEEIKNLETVPDLDKTWERIKCPIN